MKSCRGQGAGRFPVIIETVEVQHVDISAKEASGGISLQGPVGLAQDLAALLFR